MQDTRFALEILKQAMSIEQEGREFYLKAIETTEDEKGREVFRTLAGDEENHFSLIQRQYDSLVNQGQWQTIPEMPPVDMDLGRSIFHGGKQRLEEKITEKSNDWDAIVFGLEIETRSYDFYRKAATETSQPMGKKMFEFLTGEELGHFNILMMRYEALFGPSNWSS